MKILSTLCGWKKRSMLILLNSLKGNSCMAPSPRKSHFRVVGIHHLAQRPGSSAGQMLVMKGALNRASSLKVVSVRPVPPCCPTLVYLPDVSAIDEIQVLGQTEDSIQVDWKNPPAELDHFRLTHTDPTGQEEELNVQRSQEARTKHTIVGECCNRQKLTQLRF